MTGGDGNFFKMPNSVITGDLTAHEIAVFAVLAKHRGNDTNESFVGVASIAKRTKLSRPTVMKAVKALRVKGEITIRLGGTGHRQRHLYGFPGLDSVNQSKAFTGQRGLPVYEVANADLNETGQNETPKPVNVVDPNKTSNKKKNSSLKKEADIRTPSFREAVEVYLRHKCVPGGIAPRWDAAAGDQLKRLLSAYPDLDIEGFRRLLNNRARSDVNHAEGPHRWVYSVTKYATPLDCFGKPTKGAKNGNSSNRAEVAARSAIDSTNTVLARIFGVDSYGIGEASGSDGRTNDAGAACVSGTSSLRSPA